MAATAVEAWDERWATPEGRADWLVPHPAMAALVAVLKARGAQHVLDLGCGVGRHAPVTSAAAAKVSQHRLIARSGGSG
jgi:protein-L-isoaspartate O-methyltransferase